MDNKWTSTTTMFPSFVILLLLFCGVLNQLPAVEGDVIQCYVCSWQKPSQNFSVADNCTHHHFKPEYASIVNCSSGGCEAVTYRHSKSDDVYHFSRNCLNSKNSRDVDRCYNVDGNKFDYYTSRCECHSDLCNSAPLTTMTIQVLLGVGVSAFFTNVVIRQVYNY